MSPQQPSPGAISVRMYQVGFGDCFLVGFHYDAALDDGRDVRHVLFDFGTNRWPEGHEARFPDVADDVNAQTGGILDAVVVTHRHRDHLGGYGNKQAAETIASLHVKAVVRPWTDDPKATADATEPANLGDHSLAFARGLDQAQEFADHVASSIGDHERGFRGDLREVAAEQVKNRRAIDRIDAIAESTQSKGDYVFAGSQTSLGDLLPGVTTTVLGPPTIEMWPQVAGERADDPEYWLRQRSLLGRMLAASGAPPNLVDVANRAAETPVDPGPIRWIVERLHHQQTHSLLRIVGGLEDALNNTSVILLFRAGKRTLLFSGDAQIENWSYSLTSPDATDLGAPLADVDFYKVGHHGSRNATPRSLVRRWAERTSQKLTSMMSTRLETYDGVPRQPLIDALTPLGPLFRTDELAPGLLFQEVRASTADTEPFAAV